jgi:hypothetical protein
MKWSKGKMLSRHASARFCQSCYLAVISDSLVYGMRASQLKMKLKHFTRDEQEEHETS